MTGSVPVRRSVLALAATMLACLPAAAQGWPQRSITLIVSQAAGASPDVMARLMADSMAKSLGQGVVIENKPGGGNVIGAAAAARAAPDGYTLFLGGATIFCANKFLYGGSIPFDPIKDFTHLTRVSIGTTVLVVNAKEPWQTFAEFVAYAKANPGKIVMASSGQGTISHLTLAKLMHSAGIEITHVPYRGLAPGLNDLLAGQVDMMFDNLGFSAQHVRAGKLKALAVGSEKRVASLPNVPTVAEAGLPGFDTSIWFGLNGPAGLPDAIRDQLAAAVAQTLKGEATLKSFRTSGIEPLTGGPAEYARFIGQETAKWADVVVKAGLVKP